LLLFDSIIVLLPKNGFAIVFTDAEFSSRFGLGSVMPFFAALIVVLRTGGP